MTVDSHESSVYEEQIQLLIDLDKLCEDIGQGLIYDQPTSLAGDYGKQLIWTIGPSVRMLVWGLENNQNLAAMNGLRTLLENWANANYVFRAGKKGPEHYLSKMGESAEYYRNALQELRSNPSLGLKHLKQAPRWTGSGLEARVEKLGDGPLFQYEYLSRYVHADVWATLNEFDIQDKTYMKNVMLTWGIEFVNHTSWLICEEKLVNDNLLARATKLNDQVAAILVSDTQES